jgi:hypothetical protein
VLLICSVGSLVLGACSSQERRLQFRSGFDKATWSRVSAQCAYEASRAVAGRRWSEGRAEDERELLIKCLEAKGATFVGFVYVDRD